MGFQVFQLGRWNCKSPPEVDMKRALGCHSQASEVMGVSRIFSLTDRNLGESWCRNQPQQHHNSYQQEAYLTNAFFSIRHGTAFLHIKTLDNTLALCSEAISNSEITHKRHKNMENMVLNRLCERNLFIV